MIRFHEPLGNEKCLDITDQPQIRITDEQAKEAVKKVSGCDSAAEFQMLTPIVRDKAIIALKRSHLSLRQISRLTGVSIMIIRRVIEEA